MQLTMVMMSRVCHFNKTTQSKLDETFTEETDNTEDANDDKIWVLQYKNFSLKQDWVKGSFSNCHQDRLLKFGLKTQIGILLSPCVVIQFQLGTNNDQFNLHKYHYLLLFLAVAKQGPGWQRQLLVDMLTPQMIQ